jgi:serine-type anaerobic sulfatase-maturating enzyme
MEMIRLAAYQLMIKPCGPTCNLNCTYCFYLPKQKLFPKGATLMSDETLEDLTRQYLSSQDGGTITFAWQGGEPTLAGLDFYRKALALQNKYRRPGMVIENTLQTNGTLLDDQWCRFLYDNRFLVGLSVDGPSSLHDLYRKDKKGGPTSGRVVQASRLLHQHRVEFNTLTVVNRENARHPLQVYRFLRNVIGARYMQFIPCVEPKGFADVPPQGGDYPPFPSIDGPAARPGGERSIVTDWTVDPQDYGSFLNAIFDEWVQKDVGRVYVINFEVALAAWLGLPASACTFAKTCGNALAIEHDGSVYSCDHYVYPEHRLGPIQEIGLAAMASSEPQVGFGKQKADGLPAHCRRCEVLFACNGECPKNRFLRAPDGEAGLNYLCQGLRNFFTHIDPWLVLMANEIRAGRNAENVMRIYAANKGKAPPERRVRPDNARIQ